MKQKLAAAFLTLFVACGCVGAPSAHASTLQVAGWIPYWKGDDAAHDAKAHLDTLTSLYPFVFAVKKDGSLTDLAGLSGSAWKSLFTSARAKGVSVIPTVTWSDTNSIYSVLSDTKLRASHVAAIVSMVKKGGYDGVDIDYEGKSAQTRLYFALFLLQLKVALGDKTLSCTIEARNDPASLYRTIPATIEYANDLPSINLACDRVNVMTYDQQRTDLPLNDANKGLPYIPVADPAWVKKIVAYMRTSITASKLYLGVPTYGAEWDLSVAPEQYKDYGKLWAVNPSYAEDLAHDKNITPYRNAAGELSFTYFPDGVTIPSTYKAPKGTASANDAAARALAYANATGKTTLVNVVWWSDAQSVADKVALAKQLGVAGVALFKVDSGEDPDVWDALK